MFAQMRPHTPTTVTTKDPGWGNQRNGPPEAVPETQCFSDLGGILD